MIKKVKIEGFQTHTKKTLTFSKGVNVITGPTDVGKSAIIRAIVWALTNRPGGMGFINWNADFAKVTIYLTGKNKLVRYRSKTENKYILNDVEFAAFGAGAPPEPIVDFLSVNKINIQEQHDAHYWFGESAGEVSKQLNKIVNLSVIDHTLKETSKLLRSEKAKFDVTKERLDKAEATLEDTKFILPIQERWGVISETRKQLSKSREVCRQLAEGVAQLGRVRQKGKRAEAVVQGGEIIIELGTKLRKAQASTEELAEMVAEAAKLEEKISLSSKLKEARAKVNQLIEQAHVLETKQNELNKLEGEILFIEEAEENLPLLEKELNQLEEKIHKEFKHCPLCGGNLKNKTL